MRAPSVSGFRKHCRSEHGQMAVELVAVLPVALIVAIVVVNALVFFGDCSAFDRSSRNAVRLCATSPGYGQTVADATGMVRTQIEDEMTADNLEVEVGVEQDALGHARFTMTLTFHPTLFGMGLRDSVLGVALPALEHTETIVVDSYKPGMLF